jgi:hypothetical protein
MLVLWTQLSFIKISIKNKRLLFSAGLEQTNKQQQSKEFH